MNGKTTTFEWTVSHFDLDQIAEFCAENVLKGYKNGKDL